MGVLVPDRRLHRGAHPDDRRLFAAVAVPALRSAVADFAWLLSHGYARESSLKLVGDRYSLDARQRVAVSRASCADDAVIARRRREIPPHAVEGRVLWLDGYNVLTTVEAAMGGGVVLACRDGTYRDMASMHGSFRKVLETRPAIEAVAAFLRPLGPAATVWLLDRPVSNSGRLRQLIEGVAAQQDWRVEVRLVDDPDRELANPQGPLACSADGLTDVVAATADSAVLDACGPWLNLARRTVEQRISGAWVVDLGA